MEMDCRIYFNVSKFKLDNLIEQLTSEFNFEKFEYGTYIFQNFEVYIDENEEADVVRTSEFPDGFLYFSHFMELYFECDKVNVTNRILDIMWSSDIPAVAACDYEMELHKCGGYKNSDLPWVQYENE